MHQEPYFLAHLKYQDARLVFIWRQDIVAQVMSDRISDHLRKWHNMKAEDVKEPFNLDVEKIGELTKLLCLSEHHFYNNLKAYPHALTFCYERLFNANGALNANVRTELCRAMHENYVFRETGYYHKNKIEKARVVANYAEVASAIEEVAAICRKPFLAEIAQI
jgi:hypothetical protein